MDDNNERKKFCSSMSCVIMKNDSSKILNVEKPRYLSLKKLQSIDNL